MTYKKELTHLQTMKIIHSNPKHPDVRSAIILSQLVSLI